MTKSLRHLILFHLVSHFVYLVPDYGLGLEMLDQPSEQLLGLLNEWTWLRLRKTDLCFHQPVYPLVDAESPCTFRPILVPKFVSELGEEEFEALLMLIECCQLLINNCNFDFKAIHINRTLFSTLLFFSKLIVELNDILLNEFFQIRRFHGFKLCCLAVFNEQLEHLEVQGLLICG